MAEVLAVALNLPRTVEYRDAATGEISMVNGTITVRIGFTPEEVAARGVWLVWYWLLEIDRRGLHKERGFSSIGDYAMELIGVKPRKARYLVFIASRLESLPRVREAFDSGALSWTKAREVVSFAKPATEIEWLERALSLSNRELEKEARRHAGSDGRGFATLTMSVPVDLLDLWNGLLSAGREHLCDDGEE